MGTGLSRFLPDSVKAWTGWDDALAFARTLPRGPDGEKRRELLERNLEEAGRMRSLPFRDVLAAWGVDTPETLQAAAMGLRRRRLAGAALTLLLLADCCLQLLLPQPAFLRTVHCVSAMCLAVAGAALWTTSAWRLQVFRHGRFVPYREWLLRLGRVWGRNGAAERASS
ncbi:MAG: hypothetical protein LBR22_01955 [Desulfovibrio sp.]|jgi:hypothetical protein|nr:hypothetical protein [Desulfovibrio sp.]